MSALQDEGRISHRGGSSGADALATVRGVLARRIDEPGALLPILHDVQDALGYVPADAVPEIAAALNLSRAEVHGVITYYHHFRSRARRRATWCRSAAPRPASRWAPTRLLAHAQQRLGLRRARPRAGRRLHARAGLLPRACAPPSPAMMIDDELHARVTPRRLRCADGRRPGATRMTRHRLRAARLRGAGRGADDVARAHRRRGRGARRRRATWCATARAACSGSSRWSRWRRRPGRIAYGPVDARGRAGAVRRRLPRRRRRTRCASARPRRSPT